MADLETRRRGSRSACLAPCPLQATLPPRCLLFGGYCSRSLARADAKRDSGPPGLSRLFGSLGGDAGLGGLGDELPLLDRFR